MHDEHDVEYEWMVNENPYLFSPFTKNTVLVSAHS